MNPHIAGNKRTNIVALVAKINSAKLIPKQANTTDNTSTMTKGKE